MKKIKTAYAIYTGGNIWLFHGTLEDGNWFLMDDVGIVLICDADPAEDFDESLMPDWQEKHGILELADNRQERIDFCNAVLDYLESHPENRGGMTDAEIDGYGQWFEDVMYTIFKE